MVIKLPANVLIKIRGALVQDQDSVDKKIKQKISKNVVHNTEHLAMLAKEESTRCKYYLHLVVWNNLGWVFAPGARCTCVVSFINPRNLTFVLKNIGIYQIKLF